MACSSSTIVADTTQQKLHEEGTYTIVQKYSVEHNRMLVFSFLSKFFNFATAASTAINNLKQKFEDRIEQGWHCHSKFGSSCQNLFVNCQT